MVRYGLPFFITIYKERIDVLFYINHRIFDDDNIIEYLILSLETLEDVWGHDDIIVLFDTSEEESDKIRTLLGKYVEVKWYGWRKTWYSILC